ncbi:unnamed protein product [Adineta ricciae]|uniref:Uncharacterized protein n=1 Tax=Adineta ricciae TaxID=249248 RepID=A0A813VPA7_ADIRI|nr:unnamed protein product [Adineta ricciae]
MSKTVKSMAIMMHDFENGRIAYLTYLKVVLCRNRLVNYQLGAIWKCYGEVQNQNNSCQAPLIKNQLKQNHVRKVL